MHHPNGLLATIGLQNIENNLYPQNLMLLLHLQKRWRSIVMSTSECVSVCLSVCEHISGATRVIFTKVFLHVAYGRGSVFLRQGDKIPRGRGNFGGSPSQSQCTVKRSLERGHSIANNVIQQKGSFSMSGKCK